MEISITLNDIKGSWARLVSDVLSPPVVWAILSFPIAFRYAESQTQALVWASVYILLVCILPVVYIGYMVWRGKITDIHMKERKQRFLPFLVSLGCTAIAWWTLRLLGAPTVMPLFALLSLVQLLVTTLITLIWQISVHSMSITVATVTTNLLFGLVPALLTIPLILLVGAARINLKRHTPAQVLAGTLLGGLLPIAMLYIIMR